MRCSHPIRVHVGTACGSTTPESVASSVVACSTACSEGRRNSKDAEKGGSEGGEGNSSEHDGFAKDNNNSEKKSER